VRETPGWERTRVQTDSGAMDTVGPKEIAKSFETTETALSKRGARFVAANESGVKNMERTRSSDTRKMAKGSV
jgi:hypothetical protein